MPSSVNHPNNPASQEGDNLCRDSRRKSTSLDPWETSVENTCREPPDQQFRFRHTTTVRRQLLSKLPHCEISDEHKKRFTDCGSRAWVQWSPSTDKYRVRATTCKLRWCPACRQTASIQTRRWLNEALKDITPNEWKLITFTVKHSNDDLSRQISFLRKSFRRLRQRKFWREHVTGGIMVLEINYNEDKQQWHPHLHILARASYMAQKELSNQWLQVTRNSMIVDIRAIYKAEFAINYVCKYITKPPPPAVLKTPKRIDEYVTSIHGARLIQKFGDLPKLVPEQEEPDYPTDWEPISPLIDVLRRCKRGDRQAAQIISILTRSTDEPIHPDLFEQRSVLVSELPGGS